MNSAANLTLGFLTAAPKAAAQELQSLTIEETSRFLESVPARLSAPVMNAMIPWHAARVLGALSAARAAMVLRQLAFGDAISLARLMASESRERILEELPTAYARRVSRALRYPHHQVGAWMDPEVPTLSVDNSVRDALRVLRAAGTASHVFLESEEHGAYAGMVALPAIIRGEPSAELESLPIEHIDPISNRASLASLTFDERWDEAVHLPVVGRRGNLLGALPRSAVRKAMHEEHAARASRNPSLLRLFAGAFAISWRGTFELLCEAASTAPTRLQEVSDHER